MLQYFSCHCVRVLNGVLAVANNQRVCVHLLTITIYNVAFNHFALTISTIIYRLDVRSLANASRARQFNPLNPPGVGWIPLPHTNMAAVVGRARSCAVGRARSCAVGRAQSCAVVRAWSVMRGRSCVVVRGRAWSCAVGRARSCAIVRAWSCVVVRGSAWSCVVGRAWSCAVVRGRARSCVRGRSCVVVRGSTWSCVVVRGRGRSCVRGRSFVVVRGRARSVVRGRAWSCGRAVLPASRPALPCCPLRGLHCRDTNERTNEGTNERTNERTTSNNPLNPPGVGWVKKNYPIKVRVSMGTCVPNLGAIRWPVRKFCPSNL